MRRPGLHALKLKAKWPIVEIPLVSRIPEFYIFCTAWTLSRRFVSAERYLGRVTVRNRRAIDLVRLYCLRLARQLEGIPINSYKPTSRYPSL